ncbi:MAG: NAD-dependent epimerase/dehydratase family protein, partial [Pseudomonadota bacterium]
MNIIILGGTGFIGCYLQSYLRQQGHVVTAFGRQAFTAQFDLSSHLENQELLIMLAGENIGQRWSSAYKKALLESRTLTNQVLKQAISDCNNPPKRIFLASAIGIYPQNTLRTPVDESCTQVDRGFLGVLGQQWEAATLQLTPQPLIMRFGVVLGNKGGPLHKMLPAFKLGLGGPVAGGAQAFSWIHVKDLARA